MTAVVSHLSDRAIQVVVGIDTHQDQHVAVAVDQLGISLSKYHAAATTCGYVEIEQWARSLGQVRAFGIEGTGSYGAGLTRFLTNLGCVVIEVNRSDRSIRHRCRRSVSMSSSSCLSQPICASMLGLTSVAARLTAVLLPPRGYPSPAHLRANTTPRACVSASRRGGGRTASPKCTRT